MSNDQDKKQRQRLRAELMQTLSAEITTLHFRMRSLSAKAQARLLVRINQLRDLLEEALKDECIQLDLTISNSLFSCGLLLQTWGSTQMVNAVDAESALSRHARCDWGECCREDKLANDQALKCGGRLLSVYRASSGTEFWIITEADRSVTMILLPSEY